MNTEIRIAAYAFALALKEVPEIAAFNAASRTMENDSEFVDLRDRYDEMVRGFRARQAASPTGEMLSMDEIARLRALSAKVETHPVWTGYVAARAAALPVLTATSKTMSELLGFDYSTTVAPPSTC